MVVFDDQLISGIAAQDEPGELEPPRPEDIAEADGETELGHAHADDDPGGVTGAENGTIDGLALARKFASIGLVCSLIAPPPLDFETEAAKAINGLAQRADAFIFDWRIYGDSGTLVRQLIRGLLAPADPPIARLRLIVVYTTQADRTDIRNSIADDLQSAGLNDLSRVGYPAAGMDGPAYLEGDGFRVTVLGKPQSITGTPPPGSQFVDVDDIPDWLVTEFSQITTGLLRGVALESMATLRDTASHLLTRVGPRVDAAFVSHAFVTGTGRDFALQLLTQEMESLLAGAVTGDAVGDHAIADWVRDKFAQPGHAPLVMNGGKEFHVTGSADDWVANLSDRLEGIVGQQLPGKSGPGPRITEFASVTTLFVPKEDADQSEMWLAAMSGLSRTILDPVIRKPILHLGTVLRDSANHYWLCIMPVCDAVRVPIDGRPFLMTPLDVAKEGQEFDIVVPVEASAAEVEIRSDHGFGWLKLRTGAASHQVTVPVFRPGDDLVVRPDGDKPSEWKFKAKHYGKQFFWVAELRRNHAQRVAHDYATKATRIGLDESEWLRLSGRNRK
ncbi:hypothetical protein CFH99_00140 [Nocardioides aromaticivorans]|uniref:Response receiver domain-containing protein n=1 Tax=Nocardioides aromaticivorans TaxID=200618 RepID=A0ABX7PDV2_9ACTN|nr:response regulator receiver domain [Nocardioides aromaticivorans]QSR24035.1 hypothetical protein CFH99_00140 [Nocardioides aromaticivorans]